MTISVIVGRTNDPSVRLFKITGRPATLSEDAVIRLRSKEDAQEKSVFSIESLFAHKGLNGIVIQQRKDQTNTAFDVVAIQAQDADLWDKTIGRSGLAINNRDVQVKGTTVEENIQAAILSHVMSGQSFLPPKNAHSVSTKELNDFLQQNLPEAVSKHNGGIEVESFDPKDGTLGLIFKDTCSSSACPSGQIGTRTQTTNLMRQKFNAVKRVVYANALA